MQSLARIVVDQEKILVLARWSKTYVAIKIRESGRDGDFLNDESRPGCWNREKLDLLKSGKALYLWSVQERRKRDVRGRDRS